MKPDTRHAVTGCSGAGPGRTTLEERPVLIVGCQRSGTTLIRRMCNRHPRIDVMPETHLMPLVWGQQRALSHLGRKGMAAWVRETLPRVNRAWNGDGMGPRLQAVSERLRDDALGRGDAGLADAPSFFSEWLAHWRATARVSRSGEKTPSHIYYLPSLLRSMPAAQAIVMHRDPRGAGCSEWLKHQSIDDPARRFTWRRFAVRWASSVEVASRCEQTFGSERVLQLRYEDVVAAPSDGARRICAFLRESYEPGMVDVDDRNTSFERQAGRSQAGVDDRSIGRWKDELDSRTVRRLEALTAFAMESLGYARETDGARGPWSWEGWIVRAMAAISTHDPAGFNQLASRSRYPGLRPRDLGRELVR